MPSEEGAKRFIKAFQANFIVLEATRRYINPIVLATHTGIKAKVLPAYQGQCTCGNGNFAQLGGAATFRTNGCVGNNLNDKLVEDGTVNNCQKKGCNGVVPFVSENCIHRLLKLKARATAGGGACYCEAWAAAALDFCHANHKICWQNSNARHWATDPWEIAKLFMPQIEPFDNATGLPGAHALNKHSVDDFDITCLFNMMQNITKFPQEQQSREAMRDVVKARNQCLGHLTKMELDQNEYDLLMGNFEAWLQMPFMQPHLGNSLDRLRAIRPAQAGAEPVADALRFTSDIINDLQSIPEAVQSSVQSLKTSLDAYFASISRHVTADGELTRDLVTALRQEVLAAMSSKASASSGASANLQCLQPRDPEFCGRKAVIEDMHVRLQVYRMLVLSGYGGIGKTATMVEFSHVIQNCYPGGIFWLSADPAYYQASLCSLATTLGVDAKTENIPLITHQVHDRLKQLSNCWLLLADNVDDQPLVDLLERLVRGIETLPRASILISSRLDEMSWRSSLPSALRPNSSAVVLTMQPLPACEAQELCIVKAKASESVSLKEDDPDLEEFLKELVGLPLAIQQAMVFVCTNSLTLGEFNSMFKAQRTKLLDAESSAPRPADTVSSSRLAVRTTWTMNLQWLQKDRITALATVVLALLPCDLVPFSVLNSQLESSLSDAAKVKVLKAKLIKYCIFIPNDDNLTCKVHRLLQEVILCDTPQSQLGEALRLALRSLVQAIMDICSPDIPYRSLMTPDQLAGLPGPALQHWLVLAQGADQLVTRMEDQISAGGVTRADLFFSKPSAAVCHNASLWNSWKERGGRAMLLQQLKCISANGIGLRSDDPWADALKQTSTVVPLSLRHKYRIHYRLAEVPAAEPDANPESSFSILKEQGNEHYRNNRFPEAVDCYRLAAARTDAGNTDRAIAYANLSASLAKQGKSSDAMGAAESAIDMDPMYIKGYRRIIEAADFGDKMTECANLLKTGMEALIDHLENKSPRCAIIINSQKEADSLSKRLENRAQPFPVIVILTNAFVLRLSSQVLSHRFGLCFVGVPGKPLATVTFEMDTKPAEYPFCAFSISLSSYLPIHFRKGLFTWCRITRTASFDTPSACVESGVLRRCTFERGSFMIKSIDGKIEANVKCYFCEFNGCNVGFEVVDNAVVSCEDCTMSCNDRHGVQIFCRKSPHPKMSITLMRCKVHGNGSDGIHFTPSHDMPEALIPSIRSDEAKDAILHVNDCEISGNGQFGVSLQSGGNTTIENSTICFNELWGLGSKFGPSVSVCGCNIFSNGAGGIKFGSIPGNCAVRDTKVFHHRRAGIDSRSAGPLPGLLGALEAEMFQDREGYGSVDIGDAVSTLELDNMLDVYANPVNSCLQQLCCGCHRPLTRNQRCKSCDHRYPEGASCCPQCWVLPCCCDPLFQIIAKRSCGLDVCLAESELSSAQEQGQPNFPVFGPQGQTVRPPRPDMNPPQAGELVCVKVQWVRRRPANLVLVYDETRTVNGQITVAAEHQLLTRIICNLGSFCVTEYTDQKAFLWARFTDRKRITIFCHELAPLQEW